MHTLALTCSANKKQLYPCQLTEDWTISIPQLNGCRPYKFSTYKNGKCTEWLTLNQGLLTIRKGYGTDGCSVVKDFDETLPGCVVHDALRQASNMDPKHCPWSRAEADIIFHDIMKRHGANALLRWTYYLGVAGPTGYLYSYLSKIFSPPKDEVC